MGAMLEFMMALFLVWSIVQNALFALARPAVWVVGYNSRKLRLSVGERENNLSAVYAEQMSISELVCSLMQMKVKVL